MEGAAPHRCPGAGGIRRQLVPLRQPAAHPARRPARGAAAGRRGGLMAMAGATAAAETFFGRRSDQVDSWLAIQPDGSITAYSGKVELGTGVRTALAQIVAEELDVPSERVRVVMGDTGLTPDEGYTAGSMTIQNGGAALRRAAAEAR